MIEIGPNLANVLGGLVVALIVAAIAWVVRGIGR